MGYTNVYDLGGIVDWTYEIDTKSAVPATVQIIFLNIINSSVQARLKNYFLFFT